MRYFVTGGAGFIGSHLVDKLIESGEVKVYDNLSSGKKEFIQQHFASPNFSFVCADLLDLERLKKEIAGYDVVFHLAANPEARLGIEQTDLDLKQETIATYNVLEAMRTSNIKQIVFASSGTIYGETPVIPLPETFGPVLPISLYGAGKVASESLISAFCHTFDMQSWIYRFANVVGDRGTHGVIYDFIHKLKDNPRELLILGDGKQEKPYLWVDDCVEGMLFGLRKSNDQVNFFNLGTNTSATVNAIARMVVEEMGLENVKQRFTGGDRGWPGDVPQVRFDTKKMSRLGWRAKYSSVETVRRAVKVLIKEIIGEKMVCSV